MKVPSGKSAIGRRRRLREGWLVAGRPWPSGGAERVALAAIVALALASAAVPASAQDRDDRPRVGLALGGGGARGAAHVGVLRVLEEHGIVVDYVAGTSMGAVVGALYSLGLTPDEIEQELRTVDWSTLFSDRLPRSDRSMRRKSDDRGMFIPLEFGLRGAGIATPRALVAGQKFAFAFTEPGLITAGHRSFDDLPIPYRPVATDLVTGEKVVLSRGNLIRAVRSSMSIPGIFPPVSIENRLLVDGYLASNVPVDVVRGMGADVVIAVSVDRHLQGEGSEALETMTGIREQAARIRGLQAIAPELARADLVITPDVSQWIGSEYHRLAEIIPAGEVAARAHAADLAPWSRPAAEFDRWRARLADHPQPIPVIDAVELENHSRIGDEVIAERLAVPVGEPLDRARLLRSLEEVHELGLLELVDFDLVERDTTNVLRIIATEKPYGPWLVNLGGAFRLQDAGLSDFALQLRVNRREINRLGAEWRTDLTVGSEFGLGSGFYQPLERGRRWFVEPHGRIWRDVDGLYVENLQIGEYGVVRAGGGLDLGRSFGRWLELRAGVWADHVETSWVSGLLPLPEDGFGAIGPQARLVIDTLDDHRLPRRGVFARVDYAAPRGWLGSDLRYERLQADLQLALASGRGDDVWHLRLGAGSDLGSGVPFYDDFLLGGLRSLSGYAPERLRGTCFALAGAGWLHRLRGSRLEFLGPTYLGLWFDAGNTWFDQDLMRLDEFRLNGAVSLLFETALGPLHLGYGRADDGHDTLHFEFGVHLGLAAP